MNFQTRSRRSAKNRRTPTGNVENLGLQPSEDSTNRPVCIDLVEDSNSENSPSPAVVDLTEDYPEEEISVVGSGGGDTSVVCIGPIRRERRRRLHLAGPSSPETRLRSRTHQSSEQPINMIHQLGLPLDLSNPPSQQHLDLSMNDSEQLPTFDIGSHTSSHPVQDPETESTEQNKKIISCPVCLDDSEQIHEDAERQLVSTVCGHVFCNTCIQDAISSEHKCPICRKKLTKKQFHPIYL